MWLYCSKDLNWTVFLWTLILLFDLGQKVPLEFLLVTDNIIKNVANVGPKMMTWETPALTWYLR